MRRAAVRGVVDFRGVDLFDVAWWRGLRVVLNGFEEDERLGENDRARLDNSLLGAGIIAGATARGGDATTVLDGVRDFASHIAAVRFPWDKTYGAAGKEHRKQTSVDKWKAAFGDPADPATAAAIAATAAAFIPAVGGIGFAKKREKRES